MKLEFKSYIKLIVLKIDDFGSEIIDERNFGMNDEFEIMKFRLKYSRFDDCFIVSVNM